MEAVLYSFLGLFAVFKELESKVLQKVAPEIISLGQSQIVPIGQYVSLDCRVTGYPIPKVVWLKERTRMKKGRNYRLISNTSGNLSITMSLWITNFSKFDVGKYTCKAYNSEGVTEKQITLYGMTEKEPILRDGSIVATPPPSNSQHVNRSSRTMFLLVGACILNNVINGFAEGHT